MQYAMYDLLLVFHSPYSNCKVSSLLGTNTLSIVLKVKVKSKRLKG